MDLAGFDDPIADCIRAVWRAQQEYAAQGLMPSFDITSRL
jgi:hypothetical protein